MSKLGAYAHDIVLAPADGRSREGRLLKQMRDELIRHLGGSVTPPQRAMIGEPKRSGHVGALTPELHADDALRVSL
jgi:hypothetical protein